MNQAERIEQLEEEVAYLRSELGLAQEAGQVAKLRQAGLRPTGARILLALHTSNGRVLSRGFIEDNFTSAVDSNKITDVYINGIRKAIGHDAVGTAWGQGFFITEVGKQRVNQLLSNTAANHHAVKQYCIHGHPLFGDNVHLDPKTNKRRCKACHKINDQKHRAKTRVALTAA